MNVNNKRSFYLYTLIVFGIILLVNIISYNRSIRIDLTDNQIFTLSNSTKSVISKIYDNLVVSIYFSDDLPSFLSNNTRFIQDILEEYQAHSNGNIKFEFKNVIHQKITELFFNLIENKMINSFKKRADEILN